MGARGEIIPAPVPWSELPAAAAWLLGYVNAGVPGYRLFSSDGSDYMVSVGVTPTHRFDGLMAAMNIARGGGQTVTDWSSTGDGRFDLGAATVAMSGTLDRLGWLIGAGVEAGTVATLTPRYIPPAGIPLIGATWDQVDKDADRNIIRDLYRRNQGYTWGGADIFQCSLYMHRWSLDAFLTGWCQRGLVTLGGSAKLDDPWSLADPKGAITGYVVGVSQPQWQDKTQTRALVDMAIAVGGT